MQEHTRELAEIRNNARWKNETKINSIPALMLICQALMGLSFEYQLFNGNCENFANFVYSANVSIVNR